MSNKPKELGCPKCGSRCITDFCEMPVKCNECDWEVGEMTLDEFKEMLKRK